MKYITSLDQLEDGKYYLKYGVDNPTLTEYKAIELFLYTKPDTIIKLSALSAINYMDYNKNPPIQRKSTYESHYKTFASTSSLVSKDISPSRAIDDDMFIFELTEDEVYQNIILNEI
jgi:hypothetical protein